MAIPSIKPFPYPSAPPAPAAAPVKPPGFWRRQFDANPTHNQRIFDVIFGIVLPIACFVFDPIIFKTDGEMGGYMVSLRPFAYVLAFVAIFTLGFWLIADGKLGWVNGFVAGIFYFSGATAAVVGIAMLPLSIIGMFILIGFIGYTPFLSALVFIRNGVRAARLAKPFFHKEALVFAVCFAAFFSFWVPFLVYREVEETLAAVENGDAAAVRGAARKLNAYRFLYQPERLSRLYYGEIDAAAEVRAKREAVREVYLDITGVDIGRDKRNL